MANQILPLDDAYTAYLRDESRLTGKADSISFPTCEAELLEQLAALRQSGTPVTIQGGQTGIAGGAVAQGGHILNLSRMNKVLDIVWDTDGTALLRAEPGLTMMELRQAAAAFSGRRRVYWPPEPTSLTATVGGAAATLARGILSGSGEDAYIEAARLVAEDGTVHALTRSDGLLEQVLGAEGLPGVFSEVTLRLVPEASDIWGICVFFDGFDPLCDFVEALCENKPAELAVAEYMDAALLALADSRRATMVRLKALPEFPAAGGAVYLELHGTEDAVMAAADQVLEHAIVAGCEDSQIWAVSGASEVERLRELRIAAQELVGMHYDTLPAGLPRLVADMTFPGESFRDTAARYRDDAAEAGIGCCVYGHILNNHLTASLLPEDAAQHAWAVAMLRRWAMMALDRGGESAGSYGIGSLKRQLLDGLLPEDKLERCRRITEQLAPDRTWNRSAVL